MSNRARLARGCWLEGDRTPILIPCTPLILQIQRTREGEDQADDPDVDFDRAIPLMELLKRIWTWISVGSR
jgi:hypothetical protein